MLKPSKDEDEYFAREDVEKKRKLAFQQAQVMAEQQKEALRTLHYMKCPKCGFDLHTLKRGEVDLDMCFNCKGLWIDAGRVTSPEAKSRKWKPVCSDSTAPPRRRSAIEPIFAGTSQARTSPPSAVARNTLQPKLSIQ